MRIRIPNLHYIAAAVLFLAALTTAIPTNTSHLTPRDTYETKNICLTELGAKTHASSFCNHKWNTPSTQSHTYFLYTAEFKELKAQPKYKGADGVKIRKAACKVYEENWRLGACKEGRGNRWLCCEVNRVDLGRHEDGIEGWGRGLGKEELWVAGKVLSLDLLRVHRNILLFEHSVLS
ncbi:hypothetical protein P154DRAFT_570767 [Amniculicola lignicola CBS 123094]|uniref:Cyanovirin-N domain-containing protein n=1 Tax=Amniculicola lignicola CBS 123094 TaxID=1392246 RepID=A0A6A5WWP8_9PLEO|nr:hypothetical protein P154DRAFT_570767 [Amniculicola lignicola CBS 123094]